MQLVQCRCWLTPSRYFVDLMVRAYLAVRPYQEQFISTIALMLETKLPCFRSERVLEGLRFADCMRYHMHNASAARASSRASRSWRPANTSRSASRARISASAPRRTTSCSSSRTRSRTSSTRSRHGSDLYHLPFDASIKRSGAVAANAFFRAKRLACRRCGTCCPRRPRACCS